MWHNIYANAAAREFKDREKGRHSVLNDEEVEYMKKFMPNVFTGENPFYVIAVLQPPSPYANVGMEKIIELLNAIDFSNHGGICLNPPDLLNNPKDMLRTMIYSVPERVEAGTYRILQYNARGFTVMDPIRVQRPGLSRPVPLECMCVIGVPCRYPYYYLKVCETLREYGFITAMFDPYLPNEWREVFGDSFQENTGICRFVR